MLYIAWTTVSQRADADRLSAEAVSRHLAVCVQIDGPITSHYRWRDQLEHAEEFRLTFKCLGEQLAPLEAFIATAHPYETPEWIAIQADRVGEKYLSWANANASNPPL